MTGVNNQKIASGSIINVIRKDNGEEYIQIRLNINKVYKSSDYKLVFYDPFSFSTSVNCIGNNLRNTSWDSTLGWILGFRIETEYDLSDMTLVSTNGNITSIIGDNVVSINIYSYYMILLDDFNNSHMNDGIITTTKQKTRYSITELCELHEFKYESHNRRFDCNKYIRKWCNPNAKQVYAIQSTLDQQSNSYRP